MKFKLMDLALEWCKGEGLEIGAAAHNPFGVNAKNMAPEENREYYTQEQMDLCGEVAPIDIVGEADDIPVRSRSQNFVLMSHVFEHLPNPIKTLVEIDRVLKSRGIFFCIHPLPDALPADKGRPITPLEHYIEDYETKQTVETHDDDVPGGKRGHYHVATLESLKELIQWTIDEGLVNWELVAEEEVDSKVGNGFTVVYRKKRQRRQKRENRKR